MQTDNAVSPGFRLSNHLHDFLQRHGSAVIQESARLCFPEKLSVDKGTRINHHIRLLQQTESPHCNQIRGPRPCSHNMYHNSIPFCLP